MPAPDGTPPSSWMPTRSVSTDATSDAPRARSRAVITSVSTTASARRCSRRAAVTTTSPNGTMVSGRSTRMVAPSRPTATTVSRGRNPIDRTRIRRVPMGTGPLHRPASSVERCGSRRLSITIEAPLTGRASEPVVAWIVSRAESCAAAVDATTAQRAVHVTACITRLATSAR